MRTYLLITPRWQLAVAAGLIAGCFTGLLAGLALDFGWAGGLAFGSAIGALVGVSMAAGLRSTRRLLSTSVSELPADAVIAAWPGATRGPVPADPEVRATALRIAVHRLEEHRRFRTLYVLGTVICGASTVLSIDAGFGWIDVFVLAGGLAMAYQLFGLRRLRRRVQQLSTDGDDVPLR